MNIFLKKHLTTNGIQIRYKYNFIRKHQAHIIRVFQSKWHTIIKKSN